MFVLYDFIVLIYAIIYLPYLLLTRRGYVGYRMRFGLFSSQAIERIKAKDNIWVHAVSVGEVMVIDGLIDQLRKNYPAYQLIASVTTKTGYKLARERLKDKALVIPSPIDFSFVTGRFVRLINPKIYIAVETEIWPNLYRNLFQRKIPLVVINGRISDGSFGRYQAIRFLLKGILNQVSVWCMQSQKDAKRIIELGAEPSRVVMTGNIKFDEISELPDVSCANVEEGKEELWWVAGSTHPGEEEIVLDVFSKMIKDHPKWRLVIAPRHIERVPSIIGLVNRHGFKAVKWTQFFPVFPSSEVERGPEKPVIIVDTIGHLRSLYAKASLVFVGKSLCVGGGHNIIEPAIYGKAIIIGPKFENFKDIVECFMESSAIVKVEDAHAFENAVRSLCADESKRKSLGAAAKNVVAANQGAARRSLECLEGLLK